MPPQSDVANAVEAAVRMAPPIDKEKVKSLGSLLAGRFTLYESQRRLQEMKWTRNLRQFLGEYDPEVKIDKNRSQAYPRITRIKCISYLARMMNLLFPANENNWGIEPSPVPNLSMDDLTLVLTQVQQTVAAAQGQLQLSDAMIEQAIRDFAAVRARNLELEISDQLTEIGGNRNTDYVTLCRRVLLSGIMYGAGVLKGPFTREQMQRRWKQVTMPGAAASYVPEQVIAYRPQFEFVPIWEYYPDMTAKHLYQMDGQFHRMVMSKTQLRELADRPDFFKDTVLDILRRLPQGNFKEKQFESEIRTMGTSTNISPTTTSKYEVLVWDGFVASDILKACGVELPQGLSNDMAEASVWTLGNDVIKVALSPWVELEPDQRVQMYHVFIFEEDDSNLLGNGLPNIMRDSQMSIASASRMLLDNASVVCGPNLELNIDLLKSGQDFTSIQPYKTWLREGTGVEAQWPAVKSVDIKSYIPELGEVVKLFMDFADKETFVSPANGGDMSTKPSEPYRTAAGASMLHGMDALPFKDTVRNFDVFTTSVFNALLLFNKHFNDKPEVKGDFQPIARGSSSLMAKEMRGMAYDNLANTLQPEERPYVKWHQLLAERLGVRDIDVDKVLVSEQEARMIDQSRQQEASQQQADAREMLKAEVRKLLADATKALTQSDKNAAAADAAETSKAVSTYNALLAGLEKGVTPADVHAAHVGGELPAAIAAGHRLKSGADRPPKPAKETK